MTCHVAQDWREGKPYRPNVGICLINRGGLVWMGLGETSGPEIVTPGRGWQMPQGGIGEAEDIVEAARRELWEETGIRSVELLQTSNEWWTYEFPSFYNPQAHKLDRFRGQKQKWVAFRFVGDESEISITAEHTGEPQEFFDWRWMHAHGALDAVMDYKLQQYKRVFAAFDRYLA